MSTYSLTAKELGSTFQFIESEFGKSLSACLSTMLDEKVRVSSGGASADETEQVSWFLGELQQFPNAPILFGIKTNACLMIGRRLLSAAGLEEADDETAMSTLAELASQVMGSLSSAFTARLQREISASAIQIVSAMPQRVPADFLATMTIAFADNQNVIANLVVHPALVGAFTRECLPQPVSKESNEIMPVAATKNLDLLLDVEMPVSVSFGRAQLLLKDVIKLTSGSIVELNRSVSEPVDVIVNNCVIARGEVVVVEGNFGVRIKEIVSKQDRLRTLA